MVEFLMDIWCRLKINWLILKKHLEIVKQLVLLPRRVGRVVDCGGLENRWTARFRGFESLTLRQNKLKASRKAGFFAFSTLVKLALTTEKKQKRKIAT